MAITLGLMSNQLGGHATTKGNKTKEPVCRRFPLSYRVFASAAKQPVNEFDRAVGVAAVAGRADAVGKFLG